MITEWSSWQLLWQVKAGEDADGQSEGTDSIETDISVEEDTGQTQDWDGGGGVCGPVKLQA